MDGLICEKILSGYTGVKGSAALGYLVEYLGGIMQLSDLNGSLRYIKGEKLIEITEWPEKIVVYIGSAVDRTITFDPDFPEKHENANIFELAGALDDSPCISYDEFDKVRKKHRFRKPKKYGESAWAKMETSKKLRDCKLIISLPVYDGIWLTKVRNKEQELRVYRTTENGLKMLDETLGYLEKSEKIHGTLD